MTIPIYIPRKPACVLTIPKAIEPDDLPLLEASLNSARLYAERQAKQNGGD